MADKSTLKFYLTSTEPNLLQIKPSQSIGGYPSAVEYNPTALLSDPLDLVTDSFSIDGVINSPYVLLNEEIMAVNDMVDLGSDYGNAELLNVDRGALGTTAKFHFSGETVIALEKNDLFNGSLSAAGTQYRCLAVQNNGLSTFFNMSFYIKYPSLNAKSLVSIGIESPTEAVLTSNATGGTTISLIDTSLVGNYPNNYFSNRLLVISGQNSLNIGQERVIASFDSKTGTITFTTSLPYSMTSGTQYRIEQSPSQRLSSGRVSPTMGVGNTSVFSGAVGLNNAISINPNNSRVSGNHLKPFETVYLWFERDISLNTDKYIDNRIVFTTVYTNS